MKLNSLNIQSKKNVSFGTNVFQIANIDYLPCAYCGKDMISIKSLNDIFESRLSTDTSMLESAKEIGYLLKPFQQDVLSFLVRTQSEYDLENDGQVLAKACNLSRNEVSDDIMGRFYEIINLIENSNNHKLKSFLQRNFNYCEPAIRRKNSYSELVKFVRSPNYLGIHKSQDTGVAGKINDVIFDLETPNEYSVSSYLMRKAEPNPIETFYKQLFEKSVNTIEHLKPKSDGGKNQIYNFLSVCAECNSERKNIPFAKFITLRPEVKENIKKQLSLLVSRIPKLISDRKIDKDYFNYPERVAHTLHKLTDGKLDVNI